MNTKIVKISEIFNTARGGSPRPINEYITEGDGINWIMIGDTVQNEKYISKTRKKIKFEGEKKSRKVYPGDFLLTNSMSFGRPYILEIEGCIHDGWLVLSPKTENIFKDYFFYCLSSNTFKKQVLLKAAGAVVKNLNLEIVRDILVPLPPLSQQKAIAEKLDKADALRKKDQELLAKYDELAQSIFIDMFGDPVKNEKGWEISNLKKVCSKIGSGSTPRGGKESYLQEGISLVRSLNVHDNFFKYKDLAFIDENQAHDLRNVILEHNDVLFNITGASVCRCCIVPSDVLPGRVNQHVSILRCNQKLILPIFLNYQFVSNSKKQKLLDLSKSGGATREAITKQQLEKIEIILPPLSLQTQFAEKIKNIESQKRLLKKQAQQSEDLFQALLQESFQ